MREGGRDVDGHHHSREKSRQGHDGHRLDPELVDLLDRSMPASPERDEGPEAPEEEDVGLPQSYARVDDSRPEVGEGAAR